MPPALLDRRGLKVIRAGTVIPEKMVTRGDRALLALLVRKESRVLMEKWASRGSQGTQECKVHVAMWASLGMQGRRDRLATPDLKECEGEPVLLAPQDHEDRLVLLVQWVQLVWLVSKETGVQRGLMELLVKKVSKEIEADKESQVTLETRDHVASLVLMETLETSAR